MNLELIRQYAKSGDLILTGDDSFLSRLIGFAQKTQTPDGKASRWSHVIVYVDTGSVIESTMDFKPYPANEDDAESSSRLDNGVQYNYLETHKDAKYAMLLHFPFNDLQRHNLIVHANSIVSKGIKYSILGLIGSLLTYWIFRGWKSNPLATKNDLYCSGFAQEVYSIIPIDFDPDKTARNTSPERIGQYEMEGLKKIDVGGE